MTQTRRIMEALARRRFTFRKEADLYPLLAKVFDDIGVEYEAQVELSPADVIDFMLGTVGVEVKVKGGVGDVVRQLHRYAQHDSVTELILVTSKAGHVNMPATLNGKPVHVHPLFIGAAF